MKDPLLQAVESANGIKEIWDALNKSMEGKIPIQDVYTLAVNLIVHGIRMTTPYRGQAEFVVDDLFRRAKNLTLEHYDSVTGKRKVLFPYSQMIKAPFHVNESQIFTADSENK
jgi:hypothetical protein